MIKLYNIPKSGNCHKVRLLLNLLGLDYTTHNIDLANREQSSPDYLKLNPFAQAPVLEDSGVIIRDSQAILVYLASQYGTEQWWPKNNAVHIAQLTAWLSTAANEVTHGPARLRAHYLFGRQIESSQATDTTNKLLTIIDKTLTEQHWLVGNSISIADLAIYPYLALAHEGKVDITPYQHITAWFKRIESLPQFISMPGITYT